MFEHNLPGPLIVAHRGSSGAAPENTHAAFRKAVDEGCDMIELDVRMTKDFELVVLHDRSLRRTGNVRKNIWDLTLADLRTIDVGGWFGRRFVGERVPSLRSVMDQLPQHIGLNVEVKTDGDPRRRNALEELLILLIREKEFTQRTVVSSFDHRFLKRIHTKDPVLTLGALYHPVLHVGKTPARLVQSVGARIFTCSIAQLTEWIALNTRENDIVLACYGVNAAKDLEKALRHNVRAIITDVPKSMAKRLKR